MSGRLIVLRPFARVPLLHLLVERHVRPATSSSRVTAYLVDLLAATAWTLRAATPQPLAVLVAGGGVAIAAGSEDEAEGPDVAITGAALEQASEAALEHLGEGRVTDTEVGDEEGFYEVEVTLDNGNQVDVHLDADFTVLSDEVDGDEPGDEG